MKTLLRRPGCAATTPNWIWTARSADFCLVACPRIRGRSPAPGVSYRCRSASTLLALPDEFIKTVYEVSSPSSPPCRAPRRPARDPPPGPRGALLARIPYAASGAACAPGNLPTGYPDNRGPMASNRLLLVAEPKPVATLVAGASAASGWGCDTPPTSTRAADWPTRGVLVPARNYHGRIVQLKIRN
jgi:hypothetical protein